MWMLGDIGRPRLEHRPLRPIKFDMPKEQHFGILTIVQKGTTMKNVVITGASRGIGRALAERFLAAGYFVIGTSTSNHNTRNHENFVLYKLELSDAKSISSFVKRVRSLKKKIDIFVNNAGYWDFRDESLFLDTKVLKDVLEVNLVGPIAVCEKLSSSFTPGCHILNISSRRGSFGSTHEIKYPAYSISKAALNMYTKILATRLGDAYVVSSVHPGFVRTDMNEGEGELSPEEAAQDIYKLAMRKVKSGQFWYKGKHFPW
jgi:NAD(P)-dependent dehydrogenase (short-subunit alcohol dehydrogenase family)